MAQARRSIEVIAHRGFSAIAPENTLAAFRAAVALDPQPDRMELDVRRTLDGALVILHDQTVDRTTDGTGAVETLTFEAVRQLDAGYESRFGARYRGERIPTLEEVLALSDETGIPLFIELKVAGIEAAVLEAVRRTHLSDQHVLGGFGADVVHELHRLSPSHRLIYLTKTLTPEDLATARDIGAAILGPQYDLVTPAGVEAAHQAGLALWPWTLDTPAHIRDLVAWGVDGFTTNRPGLSLAVVS